MKKYIFSITVGIVAISTLTLVTSVDAQPPTITNLSSLSGPIGSSLIINGTGFNATTSQNVVFFGATKGTVTAATTTSLTVTVPLGSTYQYISVTNTGVNLTAYSAKPFIATFAGNINFAESVDFVTGNTPVEVSIADIDGDGKPDVIVINESDVDIAVYRNTSKVGSVNFANPITFSTGSGPLAISVGDIDGDGKPDLIIANHNSNDVSVLRNTSTPGKISFVAQVTFVTGTYPYSVCIGDIDGDGRPDLAVVNQFVNTVSVLRNISTGAGNINFAPQITFPTGTSPTFVSLGDIDGDGKPDLVVANNGSNNVSVLRNISVIGKINFAAQISFSSGYQALNLNIADMDGDGKPDLAVNNYGGNSISTLRNTSTPGSVNFASPMPFGEAYPLALNITDINGDGKPDLIGTDYVDGTLAVWQNISNSGAITFATQSAFATQPYNGGFSIGDIDGDGFPDLVLTNPNDNSISIFLQSGIPPVLSNGVPSGTIMPYAGPNIPAGWLLCDGSVLNISDYIALFEAIGAAWGSPNNSSTQFNLPDLRGEFLRGVDSRTVGSNDPDNALRTATNAGGNIGPNVGSFQNFQIQSHSHTVNGSILNCGSPPGYQVLNNTPRPDLTQTTSTAGGRETRPINTYVNYIIKY